MEGTSSKGDSATMVYGTAKEQPGGCGSTRSYILAEVKCTFVLLSFPGENVADSEASNSLQHITVSWWLCCAQKVRSADSQGEKVEVAACAACSAMRCLVPFHCSASYLGCAIQETHCSVLINTSSVDQHPQAQPLKCFFSIPCCRHRAAILPFPRGHQVGQRPGRQPRLP